MIPFLKKIIEAPLPFWKKLFHTPKPAPEKEKHTRLKAAIQQYLVENISCGHCTNTIETELALMPEVEKVSADKDSKIVTVTASTEASLAAVDAMLKEIGFPGQRQ